MLSETELQLGPEGVNIEVLTFAFHRAACPLGPERDLSGEIVSRANAEVDIGSVVLTRNAKVRGGFAFPCTLTHSLTGPDLVAEIDVALQDLPNQSAPPGSDAASGFHADTMKRSWPRTPGVVVLSNGICTSILPPLRLLASTSVSAALLPWFCHA